MAKEISCGLLMYRRKPSGLEFYLAHPGGPFYVRKDAGAWTVPKGLSEEKEELKAAALREFKEEIGFSPSGELISLGSIEQKNGKVVHAWAVEAPKDFDENSPISCNTFEIEWPKGTGKRRQFPEVDRAQFFSYEEALTKILYEQREFIRRLQEALSL